MRVSPALAKETAAVSYWRACQALVNGSPELGEQSLSLMAMVDGPMGERAASRLAGRPIPRDPAEIEGSTA